MPGHKEYDAANDDYVWVEDPVATPTTPEVTTPATTEAPAGDQGAAIDSIIHGSATTGGQTTTDATAGTTTTTDSSGNTTTAASTPPPAEPVSTLTPEQLAQFQQAMGNFGGMFLPPGTGPRQQDPDNQTMAPIDPNAAPGEVGSAYNSDGTKRDTAEELAAKTAAAMLPTDSGGSAGGDSGGGGGGGGDDKEEEEKKDPTITAPVYEAQGGAMLKGSEDSYGANATETLRKAMAAGADFGNMAAAEGGRNATGFARASGLSPAQAALMAGQGAEGAYNTGLGQGVDKYMGAAKDIGSLGLGEQGQGLQKYGLDIGKYGTDVAADTTRYGIDKGADQQNTSNWMNMIGAGFSAVAPFLSWLKDGTDSADGGLTVVGEAGPELVNMPKGAQVIPNHALRGYDLLASITKGNPKKSAPVTTPVAKDAPKVSDYVQLSQKLDKVYEYLKAAK